MEIIEQNFLQHIETATNYKELIEPASKTAEKILECLNNNGKILLCGNGGSAADANHLAAEFINRYKKDRNPIPAISLSANPSNITATGNDYSFDFVFSKQIEALGNKDDVLIAISTSGKSKNIIEALKSAEKKGIYTVLFTGNNDSDATKICNLAIKVPSTETPRIQEIHLILYHSICEIVEEKFSE